MRSQFLVRQWQLPRVCGLYLRPSRRFPRRSLSGQFRLLALFHPYGHPQIPLGNHQGALPLSSRYRGL